MAGRERILIAANDTMERVLDRLRSSQAEEIVLDVDGRSPLLLSVPNLDNLEESAQRQGVRLTIASTSSKVLNAARVFGLPVIDTTAVPAPSRRPDPNARLLAGEPLGDADAPIGGVAVVDDAPPERVVNVRPAPVVALKPVVVQEERDTEPETGEEGWAEPTVAPTPRRGRSRQAPPPSRKARAPRLDPYGQAYSDDTDAREETPSRSRRRPVAPPVADPVAADDAEEGWDDPDRAADLIYERIPSQPRRGPFEGIRSFWGDVRERVAARRLPAVADEEIEEDESPAPMPEDEGWDEPPYQARQRRAAEAAAPVETEAASEDTGELPEPVPARSPRTIRPLRRDTFSFERQTTDRLPPLDPTYDEADDEELADEERYVARRGASRGLVWGLIVLLTFALVALVVAYITVPYATVTLTARTGAPQVAFDVVVAEIDPNSPQGQPTNERIVIPARRLIVPVGASITKPATGVRLEPEITAGGPVVLANTSSQAVTVPKGTALAATDGRNYLTLDAVTVPPTDALNSTTLGTATVKVAAEIRGSGGNAAVGAVQGRLPSGIYYNNREAPIAGGNDRRVTTIAREDLAAAQAAAEQEARGKWQEAIAAATPTGSQAMRDTAGLGSLRVEFSAKEGADGTSVTATVAADATVLLYTPADVESAARAEADRRINAARQGEPVVPGSVQIGTPQVTGDVPGTLTYRMTASARTRAAIGDEAERAQLARDLAHQSDDEAHDTIARLPGVSSAVIEYRTGIFPRRMPWRASHITVQVAER